jgi:hypothetical protein
MRDDLMVLGAIRNAKGGNLRMDTHAPEVVVPFSPLKSTRFATALIIAKNREDHRCVMSVSSLLE